MPARRKYFTAEAIAQGRREARQRYQARNRERLNRRERERFHADERTRERKRAAARTRKPTEAQRTRRLAYYRDYLERNPAKKRAWTASKNRARRYGKRAATPKWADKNAIEQIYGLARQREAETGSVWHVDHIVPLKSALVCGLHCEANLAVIPRSENCRKNNRYWPDMPGASK